MPTTTLEPESYITVKYDVPRRGVEIEVHAEVAIDVYFVPVDQLSKWKTHKRFEGSTFLRRKDIDIRVVGSPEFESDWYLILENQSERAVMVRYEVFDHVNHLASSTAISDRDD